MSHRNNQLSPWEGAVSGTTASILANVAVYPLDLVKTRLQVQVQRREQQTKSEEAEDTVGPANSAQNQNVIDTVLQIVQKEGVTGLYSGLGSSALGTASMNFAYFYWSGTARAVHQAILRVYQVPNPNSIIKELGLGAVGGAMTQLCTNPITVVIMRQQTRKATEERKSMLKTAAEIVHHEDGWTGLWRGFKVNLILVVNPMITYGVYQWLQGVLPKIKSKIRPIDAFFLGAISKVLATVVTQPLIVAKAMLQSKPPESRQGKPFRGFTEVLLYIARHEGFRRVYKGLWPQVIKGFLMQGLMMMLKHRTDILLAMLLTAYRKRLGWVASKMNGKGRSLV